MPATLPLMRASLPPCSWRAPRLSPAQPIVRSISTVKLSARYAEARELRVRQSGHLLVERRCRMRIRTGVQDLPDACAEPLRHVERPTDPPLHNLRIPRGL